MDFNLALTTTLPHHERLLAAGFTHTRDRYLQSYHLEDYTVVVQAVAFTIFYEVIVREPGGSAERIRCSFSELSEQLENLLQKRGIDLTQRIRLRRLRALIA